MFFGKNKNDTDNIEKLLKDYRGRQTFQNLQKLFVLLPRVPVYYNSLQPEIGPDGFPYVSLYLRKTASVHNETSLKDLSDKLLEIGSGSTVNKFDQTVDWVFSLGSIIPLAKTGNLLVPMGDNKFKKILSKKKLLFRLVSLVKTLCQFKLEST